MATFNIWMNGKLVPQDQAVLPVNSAAVFYATNVFEGIRSYWSERDGEKIDCSRLNNASELDCGIGRTCRGHADL